jgi:hypothetical protein
MGVEIQLLNVTHKTPHRRYEGKTNDVSIAFIVYVKEFRARYIYVSNLISLELLLFYLIHLYMFRAFLAQHKEILYCLVSRYGKRKCVVVSYGVR